VDTKKILRDKYSLIKEENFRLKGFIEELIGMVQNNHGPHDESDIFVDCGDDECLGCMKASEYYTLNITQTKKELQSLKDQLEKAEKVIEFYDEFEDDGGSRARQYFKEKQDQLRGIK